MKKLERVTVYGSLGLRRGISDLLWAFRRSSRLEEFPAYLDDHPFQVIKRIKDEMKSGLKSADVVIMPHYAVKSLAKDGIVAERSRRERGQTPLGYDDGATIPVGVTFMAMAYDSRRVKRRDLPEDLGGLADAKWTGKLGAQSLTSSKSGNLGAWYFSFLRGEAGPDTWSHFVEGLARDRGLRTFDCIDHLLQGLLEGEVSLALTVYSLAYFREKSGGSPVALVEDARVPHMMTFTSVGLLKGSEDNPAAARFVEFLLTPVAQKIIGTIPGIAPVAPGVGPSYDFEHTLKESTQYHPSDDEFEALPRDIEEFRSLGLP